MNIFDKYSVIKENADLLIIPFLALAYYDYFPASANHYTYIAWLFDVSPSLGIAANLLLVVMFAVISYVVVFTIANYGSAYHSLPTFQIFGFVSLTLAFAPQFGINDFLWIKPSLSLAFGAVGLSLLAIPFQIKTASQSNSGKTT